MKDFIPDRDVLVKADFAMGHWAWVRNKRGVFDVPIQGGKFVGFGLSHSIQAALHSWFMDGCRSSRNGSIEWLGFERRGREIADLLAKESVDRFKVFYERCVQNPSPATTAMEPVVWGDGSSSRCVEEGKITICFSHTTAGWTQMALLSTAHLENHIVFVSEVYCPFRGLISWVEAIIKSEPGMIYINEEGSGTYLVARSFAGEKFELVVEKENYGDFPACRILTKVNVREFVAEFYRRVSDFINNEYDQEEWNCTYSMSKNEINKTLRSAPPALDTRTIEKYLDL